MIVFGIRSERLFGVTLLFVEVIAVAELKEFQIGILAVGIVRDALQSAEKQCLAHGVQVGAERVHQHHEVLGGIRFQSVVIGGACQRVVQDFVETAAHQLLGNQVLQTVGLVALALRCQAGLQGCGNLHIIISVNTEDVLYHIAIALHIHAVWRHVERQALCRFAYNLHLQARRDAFYRLCRNLLAYQRVYLPVREFHPEVAGGSGAYILDVGRDGAAGKFLHHQCRQFQAVKGGVGVDASFKAEGSIRIQAVAAGGLTHPGGVKISAFEEHVLRGFGRA